MVASFLEAVILGRWLQKGIAGGHVRTVATRTVLLFSGAHLARMIFHRARISQDAVHLDRVHPLG
jgi:hypothetical protein